MKRFIFKMNVTAVVSILASAIGLFSVGFASWTISSGDSVTIYGPGLDADSIGIMMTGFRLTSVSGLSYDTYFYEDGSNNKVSVGELKFTIAINPNQIDSGLKRVISDSKYVFTIYGKLAFSINMTNDNASQYVDSIYWSESIVTNAITGDGNTIYFNKSIAISIANETSAVLTIKFNNQLIGKYHEYLTDNIFSLTLSGSELNGGE